MGTNRPIYEELQRRLAEAEEVIRALPESAFISSAQKDRRRKVEEVIQAERDRARSYLSLASVMFVAIASDQTVTLANPKCCEILGCDVDEIVGHNWFDTFVPEYDRKRVKQTFVQLMRGEIEPVEYFENSVLTRGNEERIIAWHNTVLKDDEGNIIGTLSSGEDITERKRMEVKLRQSEEKYRTLSSNIPGMIYRGRSDWSTEIISNSEMVCGYSINDFDTRRVNWMGIIHPDDETRVVEEGSKLLEKPKSIVQEYRIITKDGSTRWVSDHKTSFFKEDGSFLSIDGIIYDITEQKQKENELRISEKKYRDLVENMVDVIFTLDTTGHVTNVNTSVQGLLGFEPEEVIGRHFTEWIPQDHQSHILPIFRRVLGGETIIDETVLAGRDGRAHHVDFRATCILREGQAIGVQGILRDITDFKRAQKEIESLSKFPSENPSPVLRVRRDGTILYSNDAARPLLAMLKTEVGGLIPSKWRCLIDEAFASATPRRQEEDIEGRIFSFVIAPIVEGGYVNLYGRDITERKQAENELQKSEERFRRFAMASGYGFAMGELTGQLVFANTATLRILEEESKEAFTSKTFYQYYIPEDAERLRNEILPIVLEKGQWVGDIPLVSAKGNIIVTEQNIFLIRDDQGAPQMVGNIITDITERTQREKELLKLNADLVLASRRAGMAEVATDVLHNVGNVLNSINVSASFIEDMVANSKAVNLKKVIDILTPHTGDLGTFLTENERGRHIPQYLTEVARFILDEQAMIAERLQSLTKNVEHLKHIIRAQQSYARSGGMEVFTSISEVIEDAVEINHAALERYGIDLRFELTELPEIRMDKQRVLQILVNLISNAKQALTECEESERVLTIRSYQQGEDILRIDVADNGVGIAPENMPRMFTYGFTTKRSGHGFGLHSSAVAARELGGSLTVRSDGLGNGAKFTLELPLTKSGAITNGCNEL